MYSRPHIPGTVKSVESCDLFDVIEMQFHHWKRLVCRETPCLYRYDGRGGLFSSNLMCTLLVQSDLHWKGNRSQSTTNGSWLIDLVSCFCGDSLLGGSWRIEE